MNETKNLETLLRSWEPRRPSPKIREALFGRPVRALHHPASRAWLVPATAAMLLMLTMFNHRGPALDHTAPADFSIAASAAQDTGSIVNRCQSRTILYCSDVETTNHRSRIPAYISFSHSRATNN